MQQRLFEDLLDSDVKAHKTKQGYTLPVSIAIHGVVLLAVVIVPLMTAEALPEPTSVVKAFFVEPQAAPPPPPPPPPPAPKAAPTQPRPVSTPQPVQENTFTAPIETPDEVRPEEGIDLGVEGGVPGGVEGGVPGGVVGGIVGGMPEAPPPPAAVRVGGQIKEPKKLKNVSPVYPDIAKQARVQGIVILECTISPQGRVTDVKLLRGIPLLDAAAVDAVKQWVYSPTLLNGVPVPVIMTVTVNFKLS
ncbi:MAG TPA: energy transducer TonB [Candidatus Limnocylindrales bacterium]|nr:energy transducer TonB [Candidatus Limnocylindrales bacterium]